LIKITTGNRAFALSLFKVLSFSFSVEDNIQVNNIVIAFGIWRFYVSIAFATMKKESNYEITSNEYAES